MDRIAHLVDDALGAGLGSAAAVSVGDRGQEIFRHVAGSLHRGGPALDANAMFDLASLTKPMATVAIAMILVAERRLDLAAPVRSRLPGAATTGTVRQLLGHSAGCAAYVEFFRQLRAQRPAEPRTVLVDRAMREPCDPPGTQAIYSDLGFIQLGALLERAAGMPLEQAFAEFVAGPLGLTAHYAQTPIAHAVATELDERGLVSGLVHDENCYYGGRVAGHAGLFATLDDVVTFARVMVEPRGRFVPHVVADFFTDAPVAGATWRLGWDTPNPIAGISQAGDRWPRTGAVGHTGFTGTSLWLDLANRRWVVLLTNRVHPTRFGTTADAIKTLRRAINDAVVDILA